MTKKISVATVQKRMNRILTTYKEQVIDTVAQPTPIIGQSTSTSTFGQMIYSTERGLELHKQLLNFAAQNDSDSDSEPSYSIPDSPPTVKSRRSQPIKGRSQQNRGPKRTGIMTAVPIKRKQRKVSATITSQTQRKNGPFDGNESDDTDTTTAKPIKATNSFNENDNRQEN